MPSSREEQHREHPGLIHCRATTQPEPDGHPAPARVLSCPLEAHRPSAVTRWGDGGIQLGQCALRAIVEKPVAEISRPSPYHLPMPPRRSCGAESYGAGATK